MQNCNLGVYIRGVGECSQQHIFITQFRIIRKYGRRGMCIISSHCDNGAFPVVLTGQIERQVFRISNCRLKENRF